MLNFPRLLMLLVSLVFISGLSVLSLELLSESDQAISKEQAILLKRERKGKKIVDATIYLNRLRANVQTGKYEFTDRIRAIRQADALKQNGSRTSAFNLVWEEMGPDNVGGRSRALVIDKDDPNRIYAGSVSGGFWISEDGAATWRYSSSGMDNINVASIAQAPNGNIYAGTGEGNYAVFATGVEFGGGYPGNGIYRSTDKGESWVHLPATSSLDPGQDNWAMCNRIAIDPNNSEHLFAATYDGVWESTNAGDTWIQSLDPNTFPNSPGSITHDLRYTADGQTLLANVNSDLFRSEDNGATWVEITDNIPTNNSITRIEIAPAPSDANYIYIGVATNSGTLNGIYLSTDKGDSFTVIGLGGSTNFEPYNGQGDYDNTLAVSPFDKNKLYLGGVTFWSYSPGTNWKRADQGGGASNPRWIHADKHTIVFDPTDQEVMYIAGDGGVFKSENAFSSFPTPTYRFSNKGFNVTQFYAIGAARTGEVIGGSQDNSTQYINFKGNTPQSAVSVTGGDGGYCDISLIDDQVFFVSTQFGNLRKSGNRGASIGNFFDLNLDSDGDGSIDGGAGFIAYIELFERFNVTQNSEYVTFTPDRDYAAGETITLLSNENNYPFEHVLQAPLIQGIADSFPDRVESKLALATNGGLWITPDAHASISPRWYRITGSNGVNIAALSEDGNTMFIGRQNGQILKVEGIATLDYDDNYSLTGSIPPGITQSVLQGLGSPVTGISIDPSDPDHILVTTGGYFATTNVWQTTDGQNFSSIQGNLPNMPAYDCVISWLNPDHYIIGTDIGMWASNDGGVTWGEENDLIDRVPCFRVRQIKLYSDDCPVIYIGTHGRGIFRTTTLTPDNCEKTPGIISGIDNIQPTNTILDFTIFPNPASDVAKIRLQIEKTDDVQINLISLPGQLVKQLDFPNTEPGEMQTSVDVSDLAAGNYLMSVQVGSGLFESRLFTVSH